MPSQPIDLVGVSFNVSGLLLNLGDNLICPFRFKDHRARIEIGWFTVHQALSPFPYIGGTLRNAGQILYRSERVNRIYDEASRYGDQ